MKFIFIILSFLGVIVPLLIAVAFLTLAERKVLAAIQRRKGPNVVGFQGLLQPLADGAKLILKETILPSTSNKFIFILAPMAYFFTKSIKLVSNPFWRRNRCGFEYCPFVFICGVFFRCIRDYYFWMG